MYSIDSQYVISEMSRGTSEGPASPDLTRSDRQRYFRFSRPEVALDGPVRSRTDVVVYIRCLVMSIIVLLKAIRS